MIVVDEREPVGELPPPFPPRCVQVKEDADIRALYDLKKEIGRGRFGTVYMVEDKATGQKFAAKFVNTKRNQDRANVEREVEIMKALNAERPHPRLIQLYDAYDMVKEMCLVLEIVDGGELFERVIDDDFILTERACTVFLRQICEGVEFIHSKNILHLDMKPENILCLSREGNRVKICDFGLARRYDPRKKLQVLFGTPEFVAPEVVNFEPISFGTDMWSVGVICYVLLSGLSPFMGHNYVETMTNVTHNKYDFDDEAFDSVSDEAKDFIQKLLVLDKSLRLTPAQCLRHEWLRRPPMSQTLRRSRMFASSDSESETETEGSDECSEEVSEESEEESQEEKIAREEKEKREEEFRRSDAEAKRKELEKQIEDKKKEIERIKNEEEENKKREAEEEEKRKREAEAEARRKALEREIAENKRKEAERKKREEEERRQEESRKKEEAERKRKEAERRKQEEERRKEEEEEKRKKEEEERRKKEEAERLKKEEAERKKKRDADKKKEEELERTKAQLKEFVERWNSHPNSPYIVGTPLPLDIQRLVQAGGFNSRASMSSIAVAPPTDLPDPSALDEDIFILNDLEDAASQGVLINEEEYQDDEEFTVYKINPPEPTSKQQPLDVARQLEDKLSKLQKKDNSRKGASALEDTSGKKFNRSTKKLSDITNKSSEQISNDEVYKKTEEGKKKAPIRKKSNVEINIDDILEKKKPTIQIPEKMREENMEKHKRAYEERKRKKSMEQMRDKTAEELRQEEQKEARERKKPILPIKRTKSRTSQEPIEAEQIISDILQGDHKSAYEEYKKMMDEMAKAAKGSDASSNKNETIVNGVQNDKENFHITYSNSKDTKTRESVNQTNIKKDEKAGQTGTEKISHKQLQRKVSDATKASEMKLIRGAKDDGVSLKRPEIVALQHEELGGVLPRQRKKSASLVDQPNQDDMDSTARGSRGSTPSKQLKKLPSRDVPLQASRATPPGEDEIRIPRQNSLEIAGSPSRLALNRKPSREDRPPSRESEREVRPTIRRPSRDVPLTPAQRERLASGCGLGSPELAAPPPQAWPDLIVAPQGEDTEDLHDYKDSLDVPVATLMKSPSGTLLSVPGLTVSKDDRPTAAPPSVSPPPASRTSSSGAESFATDSGYVSNNKLVAWIMDIGCNQSQQPKPSFNTSERVNQWESRSPSPRLTPSPTRDRSPRSQDRSPLPPNAGREKSPKSPDSLPPSKTTSRQPSSDNFGIQTPWGPLRRSPSNLSKSSSSEVSASSARDTSPAAPPKSESQSRSVSPRIPGGRLQRQAATDLSISHLSDEIPPKPPEPQQGGCREEGRGLGDTKSHTLPRNSKLMKQQSLASFSSHPGDSQLVGKRPPPLDIKKTNEDDDLQSLKRKSKFPPSPNQKKKIGPMLFSAQDRISQFERQKPNSSPQQLPLTRTRSSVTLTLSSDCPLSRSKSGVSIGGSKPGDKTQVGFVKNRLLDKVGMTAAAALPEEPDTPTTSNLNTTRRPHGRPST